MKKQDMEKVMEYMLSDYLLKIRVNDCDYHWICGQLSFCVATGLISDNQWNIFFGLVTEHYKNS